MDRPSARGPGKLEDVSLSPYRGQHRFEELVFDLARDLARTYIGSGRYEVPAHVLIPQLIEVVRTYLRDKVTLIPPYELPDASLSPYYGWATEILAEHTHGDTSQGKAREIPVYERNRDKGSTDDVDFWTSREVREVIHSHLNYVVADTKRWEQSAACYIDKNAHVHSFVKNAGLGVAISYIRDNQPHDYEPDFIIWLQTDSEEYLILETKGYDPYEEIKKAAAERWVNAVNADGKHGHWQYRIAQRVADVNAAIADAARSPH